MMMDILDQARAPASTMGNIAKLRYSHDAMIDMLVARPGITQNELAIAFGYTPSWISNIMASDLFKDRLAARRAEIIDPVITNSVKENMEGIVRRSQEVLMEKLDKPNVADSTVLKAMELGARAIGLGGQSPVVIPVSGDHLATLANRLVELKSERDKGVVYEGEVVPQAV